MIYSRRIDSVDSARKAESAIRLKENKTLLHSEIEVEIQRREADVSSDRKDINQFMIGELHKLLAIPIKNDKDLECVRWLFNLGELRTDKEIEERLEAEYNAEYISSGRYAQDCFNNKTLWGFFGFFIPFVMSLLIFWKKWWIFAFVPAIFSGLLFSFIGMVIATNQNIARAKEHNVPPNHPRLQHDLRERQIAGVAGVASAISIGRHTKKAVKGITDVDSWKEFK